jgi:nucleotide-binding universal stress UspA family protein
MGERVIVAIDGEAASSAALEWVLDRSRTVELEVRVTTVMELDWAPAAPPGDVYRETYERVLETALGRLREAQPSMQTTGELLFGNPLRKLVAASRGAELLVVGSKRTGAVAGFAYGTLPLRVAAHAHCVVVVVPAGWTPSAGVVVAGVDGFGTGNGALFFAAVEAERRGCELQIVHSWTVPRALDLDLRVSPPLTSVREASEGVLQSAVTAVRESYPALQVTGRLEEGPAAQALVQAGESAQLVAVGTHGRGPVGGLILGSVSHDVLLNMPCPVAVVPPGERDSTSGTPA